MKLKWCLHAWFFIWLQCTGGQWPIVSPRPFAWKPVSTWTTCFGSAPPPHFRGVGDNTAEPGWQIIHRKYRNSQFKPSATKPSASRSLSATSHIGITNTALESFLLTNIRRYSYYLAVDSTIFWDCNFGLINMDIWGPSWSHILTDPTNQHVCTIVQTESRI